MLEAQRLKIRSFQHFWTLAILGSEHAYVRTDLQDTACGGYEFCPKLKLLWSLVKLGQFLLNYFHPISRLTVRGKQDS
jgi:hypothetical protein